MKWWPQPKVQQKESNSILIVRHKFFKNWIFITLPDYIKHTYTSRVMIRRALCPFLSGFADVALRRLQSIFYKCFFLALIFSSFLLLLLFVIYSTWMCTLVSFSCGWTHTFSIFLVFSRQQMNECECINWNKRGM